MSAPIESSGQTTHGSSRKRRASQACSTCRARKVRCDMLETGLPCSRCRIDRFECATEPRKKRGRRAVHGHAPNLEVRDEAPGTGSPPPPFSSSPRTSPSSSVRALPKHSILHQVPYSPFLLEFANVHLDRDDLETQNNAERLSCHPLSITHDDRSEEEEEDILFLRRKGAFDLPPRHLMDQFVAAYFKIFHPFFPVIDKETFLKDYYYCRAKGEKSGRHEGPSLLLLQAVLFVASSVRAIL